jgi:spermidine synthase
LGGTGLGGTGLGSAGPGGAGYGGPKVLERVVTRRGELVLRQAGTEFEIISNGVFLSDTRDGRSERLMVTAALARCTATTPAVLICGLGVGFALAEAVSQAHVARIDVVEISTEIIGWHATHLRHLAAPAWDDRRVRVFSADVVAWLARRRGPYDVICIDVDNGPEWTVWDANRVLYRDEGLRRVRDSLRPGGVVSVWSAAEAPAFEDRLRRHFTGVHVQRVAVSRGRPDVVYLAERGNPGPARTPGGPSAAVSGR